ncbi:MAG: succinate dehydrogenase, hydrophobic membrane anchor protein [Pseudomonadales bacterium]|jgi:succinate dehydrogenase / fumarate reductase membrane anchor subunit
MVTQVTSFGRSGLSDWVVQRVSAVILGAYTIFLLFWVASTPDASYEQWTALFSCTAMRIFSLLSLLSLIAHAWIGIWTIATDYLTPMSFGKAATKVRFLFLCACAIVLFVYFIWGIDILWGVK